MRPKALLGEECASRRHDCNRHDEIVEADVCFGDDPSLAQVPLFGAAVRDSAQISSDVSAGKHET
jgi:hypothetical protein